jgi:hypothetical protein
MQVVPMADPKKETYQVGSLVLVGEREQVDSMGGFDKNGRRRIRRDFRRVDEERLLLVEEIEWRYASPRQPEFDPAIPRQVTRTRIGRANSGIDVTTDDGGLKSVDVPYSAHELPVPRFGDWGSLLYGADPVGEAGPGRVSWRDDLLAELAQLSGDPDVWRLKPVPWRGPVWIPVWPPAGCWSVTSR